jgi:hypothetical protein
MAAMLKVFVMVICFMITKPGRLHGTISQGEANLANIFLQQVFGNCNKTGMHAVINYRMHACYTQTLP